MSKFKIGQKVQLAINELEVRDGVFLREGDIGKIVDFKRGYIDVDFNVEGLVFVLENDIAALPPTKSIELTSEEAERLVSWYLKLQRNDLTERGDLILAARLDVLAADLMTEELTIDA